MPSRREAMQMALAALSSGATADQQFSAILAIEAELAKPEPVPVCWASDIAIADQALSHVFSVYRNFQEGMVPLYKKATK